MKKSPVRQPRWKTLLWAWLPVLIWLGILVIESTSMLSSNNTKGLLYPLLKAIFGRIDPRTFDLIHAVVRKSGHFVGYAVLSLLFFRALVRSRAGAVHSWARNEWWRMAAFAVAFTFLAASLDEWHQTLLPSRTGAFHDVLLDTSGAIAIQLLALFFRRRSSDLSQASLSAK